MDLLKDRILKDGKALSSEILKVDSFINHQVDPELMKEIGIEFAKYFKDKKDELEQRYNFTENTIIHNNDLSMSFCYNRLYHTKERKDNA